MARRVVIPATAAELPMPTLAQQRERIPRGHPRLFLRPEDLPRIREQAAGAFTNGVSTRPGQMALKRTPVCE